MADFYIGQNDLPLWTETLLDENGAPININGTTLTMTMVPNKGGADVITAGGVVQNDDDGTPANRGKVHRQMLAGETATPGDYLVRVVATGAGKPISFPNTGFFVWTISPTALAQQRRYVGIEELKNTMGSTGTAFLDADLDVAIEAASRYLEADFNDGKPWTKTTAGLTRYYTRTDEWEVELGDVLAITSVDLDYSVNPWRDTDPSYGPGWGSPLGWGAGSYGTNLPASSYRLLPITSGLVASGGNGEPYRLLDLARGTTVYKLPSGRDAIRVTGTFGWESVPMAVKMATSMIASRLMRRMRDAPFGIVSFGADDRAIAVRQIATDPDIQAVMMPVSAVTTKLFA